MKRLYTIFLLLFALTGCSGFLEEYSQDQAYVEGYDDLDELLLGNAYFERNQVMSWYSQGNSGDLYYPWIHVLADELEPPALEADGPVVGAPNRRGLGGASAGIGMLR